MGRRGEGVEERRLADMKKFILRVGDQGGTSHRLPVVFTFTPQLKLLLNMKPGPDWPKGVFPVLYQASVENAKLDVSKRKPSC